MKTTPIVAGAVFDVAPFPFVRHKANLPDDEGEYVEVDCWKPGVRMEDRFGQYDAWQDAVADGIGSLRLTVVSVHTPPGFPQRVFFLRTWTDPDGKAFGRRRLMVTIVAAFRRRAEKYGRDFSLGDREYSEAIGAFTDDIPDDPDV